jgi:hypothetical protein
VSSKQAAGDGAALACGVLAKSISSEFFIIDGAAGLDRAIAAAWNGVPVQCCIVHKHRNLLGHASSVCMRRSRRTIHLIATPEIPTCGGVVRQRLQ